VVAPLAAKYGVPASSVHLRYTQQRGYLPVTTTHSDARMAEALAAVESQPQGRPAPFTLTAEEVAAIDAAGAKAPKRRFWTKYYTADQMDTGFF
jgi:diketogulonate reductase-like aldo/keto reductase